MKTPVPGGLRSGKRQLAEARVMPCITGGD